mgnify:CR=1 FL=1
MGEQYYFIGVGGVGRRALQHLISLGVIKGVLDNDSRKWGTEICGFTIRPYDRDAVKGYNIIIGFFDSGEFEEILKKDGIRYWSLADFITQWYQEKNKQAAVAFLDIPITSRCSLNCRHCMQYIPYRKEKKDVSLNDMKKRLGHLYDAIDFILEASIIGGEPFMHPELADIITSIDRKKIKNIVITTNGMVMPSATVLKVCKENDIFISISDYGKTLPHIKERIDKFESIVKESGIKCERKNQVWFAPGMFTDEDEMNQNCSRTHFQLTNHSLWYCSLQCGASLSGVCTGVENEDFILLNQNSRDHVSRFLSGRRTSVCDRCGSKMGRIVPVAEQI